MTQKPVVLQRSGFTLMIVLAILLTFVALYPLTYWQANDALKRLQQVDTATQIYWAKKGGAQRAYVEAASRTASLTGPMTFTQVATYTLSPGNYRMASFTIQVQTQVTLNPLRSDEWVATQTVILLQNGLVSEFASVPQTLVDTYVTPRVTLSIIGTNQIIATFSREMSGALLSPLNFSISGPGQGTLAVHPTSVTLVGNPADPLASHTYLLTWATGANVANQLINVVITNVGDSLGNNTDIVIGYLQGGMGAPTEPFLFTNAGATGRFGPSQAQVNTAYAGTPLSGKVTVNGGIQNWTVPFSGIYTIVANGAQGASGDPSRIGGRGASITGNINLTQGTVVKILVGQRGLGQSSGSNGGGGGGTFVTLTDNSPILVAGGGGGTRVSAGQNGLDGRSSQYGGTGSGGSPTHSGSQKITDLSMGGIPSSWGWGSGGGGMAGSGANDGNFGTGGSAYILGGAGGTVVTGGGFNAEGGFGGGGSGNGYFGGGGAGGYSGGDGGRIAGAGGSFNSGTNGAFGIALGGGHGKVTITYVGPNTPLVAIEMVPVGDPGNLADPNTGTLYGGVASTYQIGKYEVTNDQYCAFLNVKTNTYGLYDSGMSSDVRGGIALAGSSGSFSYAPKTSMGNKPIVFVSFYGAIRFVNWLHNGARNDSDTETGAYTITGGGNNSGTIGSRNATRFFFLPTENEWYKAAYYQGSGNTYTNYPWGNTDPNANNGKVSGNLVCNFLFNNSPLGTVSTVGSYLSGVSHYGTFDQAGNAWEWNETIISGIRGVRGGGWDSNAASCRSSNRGSYNPSTRGNFLGFRVCQ